jgi:mannose-1-phosphate guanylyltransferase
MPEPWCVLLASQEDPRRPEPTARWLGGAEPRPALKSRDPLAATLSRAATVTSLERIAAVVSSPAEAWLRSSFRELGARNLLVQPKHLGTGHEVLLALLRLESRVSSSTPVLFLPTDHLVDAEEVMTNSLMAMAEWIADEPRPVYLLGAVPQGPHDQLGYILPWYDAMLMPTGVYEFVETPDVGRARKLINAGGLWNTFIFGGTIRALIELFRPRFDATVDALRSALACKHSELELARVYQRLGALDFSRDVLERQTDNLNVLRLLRCGWWPRKPPTLAAPASAAPAARLTT